MNNEYWNRGLELNNNNKIGQSQHGFMKGEPCLTNLLEVSVVVISRVYKEEPAVGIFELSDSVNIVRPQTSLNKVSTCGCFALSSQHMILCVIH